jgi:UDP-N-acetylmuramate--alanine ligase
MHIFFSGIGGAGIGPLSMIAKQAGYTVSGSDKQESDYLDYLRSHGVTDVYVGQTREAIELRHQKNPIDWFVYSSAVAKENPDAPELEFCQQHGIKTSKRDEFLKMILKDKNLKLVAVAGTHGKTTTTAMVVWAMQQLNIPTSHLLPAKTSFTDMGHYEPDSQYFVYECDEYDRNFLSYEPHFSLITGIDWDHPDIYPTRSEYYQAFVEFIAQSERTFAHPEDLERIGLPPKPESIPSDSFTLAGNVNRKNAQLVVQFLCELTGEDSRKLIAIINDFPGVSRRFEKISDGLFTDYAHTPEKIRGAIQLAREVAGDKVVVVYEGLHNTRQHFIKTDLLHLFDGVKQLYIVPSYLAREDQSLEMLTPEKLVKLTSQPEKAAAKQLNKNLVETINGHIGSGDLVLCLSAGGGNSLDEWLRKNFKMKKVYFACSIAGGRDHAHVYSDIVQYIKDAGGKVLSELFADKELSDEVGMNMDPHFVWNRDVNWVKEADVIIAEVTQPSLGVGYELGLAEHIKTPVLALFNETSGRRLSPMISGNPNVEVVRYKNIQDTRDAIKKMLET